MDTNSPIFGEPAPDQADEPHPLRRQRDGRVLAGVATGLARYLDVDVALVRVGFGALVVIGGIGIPAYLACWLLVPEEGDEVSLADDLLHSAGWHGAGDGGDGGPSRWRDSDLGAQARSFVDHAEDAMHRAAGGGTVR
jgi:phage shock protein C